jgi:hypothetical protein
VRVFGQEPVVDAGFGGELLQRLAGVEVFAVEEVAGEQAAGALA